MKMSSENIAIFCTNYKSNAIMLGRITTMKQISKTTLTTQLIIFYYGFAKFFIQLRLECPIMFFVHR